MSRVTGKPPSLWRRPITRTYDYNMALGENYYKPQLDYIASRKGRGRSPPAATTFAERLLKFPPGRRSASGTRHAEEEALASNAFTSASSVAAREEASMSSAGRYASLNDLGLDDDLTLRRRKLFLRNSQENLSDRGVSPMMSPGSGGGKNRVTFSDKMLDAIGVKEESLQQSSKKQSSMLSSEEGDAIDKILAERRNRRQAGLQIQSADADLFTEDPFKSPQLSNRLQQARQQLDQMRVEMKNDADTSTSRFRNRIRAKREREQREDQDFYGSLSALNDSSSSAAGRTSSSSAYKLTSQSQSQSQQASSLASSSAASAAAHSILMAQADEADAETEAILNKVEAIRKRAKARLAQISDDFGDLQIESSLASRRAASRQALDDDLDSDFMTSSSRLTNNSSSGSKSLGISKRTVRSSYEIE